MKALMPKTELSTREFNEMQTKQVRSLRLGQMDHYVKVAAMCRCRDCFCCKVEDEFKLRFELYDKGYYRFPAPPVSSNNWGKLEWVYYIDANGQWLYYKLEHRDLRFLWVETYALACRGSRDCLERQLSEVPEGLIDNIKRAFGLEKTASWTDLIEAIVMDDEPEGYNFP